MSKLIGIIFLLNYTIIVSAQQIPADTTKFQSLDEVFIQSYNGINSKNIKTKRKDGQARTERLLDYIPGVSIISRGNFAQEPVIRGLSDGQINITLNGMRVYGACTDRMDPATSYIEPNNLRSIKLNHGPDIEAGGSTIGGAVNFLLKEPELNSDRKIKTSISAGIESNALARQFLGNLQYSTRRFAVYINGIYRKADNYTPGGNKDDLRSSFSNWTKETGFTVDEKARILFSQYEKWNAGIAAQYQLGKNHFLNADYIADRGKNIGYPALTMDVAFANADIVSLSHKYNNNIGKLYSVETKLYYNFINHAMDDTKRPAAQVPMHMDMPGNAKTAGFYSKGLYLLNPHQKLYLKLEGFTNRWHAEMTMYDNQSGNGMFMLTIPDAQRTVLGIDVADDIHVNDALSLQAGLHAESNHSSVFTEQGRHQLSGFYSGALTRNSFLWNAYLQAAFKLNNNWQLNAKLARAMRAATLKELYAVYLFNRVDAYDYLGNPGVNNESSMNADIGLRFKSPAFSGELRTFGYFFQNYIAAAVQEGFKPMTMEFSKGVKKYTNLPAAKILGAEISADWQALPQLNFTSVNTFQYGNDKNNNALPMISPFRSVNKAEWTPLSAFNFFVESVYAAKQNNVSAFYGERSTPAFNIINAGVVKDFALRHSKLTVSTTALNIFNQYYTEHLDVMKLPRAGRNFVFHTTLYF